MNKADAQLDAGGLLPPQAKVDKDATEHIVARCYRHAALGDRLVIRLASDRLGEAEDLAMEFLGFEKSTTSKPIAVQQRRSLGFAAWALINDPGNARYALNLVKRMKAAARKAKAKPGHAWDAFTDMSKELGRSVRHFLPPYWEDVGRTFKDLGNHTYAGRALNKSLEAERVHALESDRARRRDVVLEFVLAGCLAGKALSDYARDLLDQYKPDEAFTIFRDLCVRRTRGGMAPWGTMPKDFVTMAKAAQLDGDEELEKWLEEIIETPAMGRASNQFWKHCSKHCRRIVGRCPAFAISLLRHTRPERRSYGESKLGAWLELLEQWDVFPYLWKDGHQGAPALDEPIATWFGRIIRDEVPAPTRTLELLKKLTPRLRMEETVLQLSQSSRQGRADEIDIDVLEACLVSGIRVDDPPDAAAITFNGWLQSRKEHEFRNQDVVESCRDERFRSALLTAMDDALSCRGGTRSQDYWAPDVEVDPFPAAAAERDGIKALWFQHASGVLAELEDSALESFQNGRKHLESTLWPDTLRLFPDLAERLSAINPVDMLQRTLQAGVFDEYGWPNLEATVDTHNITIKVEHFGDTNISLTFPNIVVRDKVHAFVIGCDGQIAKRELRLPTGNEVTTICVIGDDLAIAYRDKRWDRYFFWASDPAKKHPSDYNFDHENARVATVMKDGSVFLGKHFVRSGDVKPPESDSYFHDGKRFWSSTHNYDVATGEWEYKIREVDPQTGKTVRDGVPPWFEKTRGGELQGGLSELNLAPEGLEDSPLGMKDGFLGWKTIKRRDSSYYGEGIDGRVWDKPLLNADGSMAIPIGLLKQPGAEEYLPLATLGRDRIGAYSIWDPSGTTEVARLTDFELDHAQGQVTVLPIHFWHLLVPRHEPSSKRLRSISHKQCQSLMKVAAEDREDQKSKPASRRQGKDVKEADSLAKLLPAVKKFLPKAPERMVLGIAHVIQHAEREGHSFSVFRAKNVTASKVENSAALLSVNHKSDSAADQWDMARIRLYGDENHLSLSAHLREAAAFLKGESEGGELPPTGHIWYSMLNDLRMGCWKTFWQVTAARMKQKVERDDSWLEFLQFWAELGLAELPGEFTAMVGVPAGVKKKRWGGYDIHVDSGTSFTIKNGKDLFVVIQYEAHDQMPYRILRYSTAKTPGAPPGYRVKDAKKLKNNLDAKQMTAFSAGVRSGETLPIPTPEEIAVTAEDLSASPAEIGLIWIGGLNVHSYESNFLPADIRKAFGWKATDASAGRQSLQNLNAAVLDHLYGSVIAKGLTAPFGEDRALLLQSIRKTWRAKMPKRLALDAPLQKRLSALDRVSRWHRVDHETLLSIAADPKKHRALQPRDLKIQVSKEEYGPALSLEAKKSSDAVMGDALRRSIVQLVSMVHAETPAGHAARHDMPALIQQTTKLYANPKTLLNLRRFHLHDYGRRKPPKPSEWLNTHLGKTQATGKDGVVRFDDGLLVGAAIDARNEAVVAFRPAKLQSESDMSRVLGILAIDLGEDYETGDTNRVSVLSVLTSPGFQALAQAILAKDLAEGMWPQNPCHTAQHVVGGIQKKLTLGEDAAVAYAQLLALPDPTTANMRMWNGWSPAQLKKALAELVQNKLVLEAKRSRAGRTVFLFGEWAELKAPWLPIETWKLPHLTDLTLTTGERYPVGGPMVLRPFEDLFAAAWQSVLDGDEPRYEEVKRTRK